MSNIIEITKVLLKNNIFGFSSSKKKGKKASSTGNALSFFLVIFISGLFMGIPIVLALDNLLSGYNFSELILSFAIPLGGVISVIFGVFSIVSVFYLNKDSEHFLHFPIKSSELLVAKFFASLVSEYLMLIMFVFPIILGVGIGIDAGGLFYVYSALICALMPIIPSVIMALIIMISNKLFKFGKRKDLFMYVMTGIILIFAFTYSFCVLKKVVNLKINPTKFIVKPLISAVVMVITAFFGHWLVFTLTGSKLISIVLSIGVSAIIYFALIFVQKTLSEEEVCELPKGDKILKLLKKIKIYK